MKRRFRFRLERILEARRIEERRKHAEIATLDASRTHLLSRRRHGVEHIESLHTQLAEYTRSVSCSVHEMVLMRGEIEAQVARLNTLDDEVSALEESMLDARHELESISRNRVVLERLREHEYEAFLVEVRREEARELDEVPARAAAWRVNS